MAAFLSGACPPLQKRWGPRSTKGVMSERPGNRCRATTRVSMQSSESIVSRRTLLQWSSGAALASILGSTSPAQAYSKNKRAKLGPTVDLGDGLSYREVKVGDGYEPEKGDTVAIHYSLFCDDVEVETSRDSQGLAARPLGFTFGADRGPGAINRGVVRGMEGMKVGGQRLITVPPQLGFGKKGRPPLIPPNSTVEFAVSLLSVKRQGSNPNVSNSANSRI